MQWYLEENDLMCFLQDFMNYNRYPYKNISTWNDTLKRHDFSALEDQQPCTLVIMTETHEMILNGSDEVRQQYINFLQQNNIWVYRPWDGFNITNRQCRKLAELDHMIPKDRLTLFFCEHPVPDNWVNQLKNTKLVQLPNGGYCMRVQRLNGGWHERNDPSKDYMLTMIKRANRPHRDILWNELSNRPGMLDRGHAFYHDNLQAALKNYQGFMPDCFNEMYTGSAPSMDLYKDSWFEIVPEAHYQDCWTMTEKLPKTLSTHTPFLILTTPGFLQYMKDLGFRTFDHVIDESYDLEPDMEKRTKMLVDIAEHIIKNGAASFYEECKPQIKHNHDTLCNIYGRYLQDWDRMFQRCIEELRPVDQ